MLLFSEFRYSRLVTALRLAGLAALVYWQFNTTHPLGLHGRGLTILVIFSIGAFCWLAWMFRSARGGQELHQLPLSWELFGLAGAAGALVGASPDGPSNVFLFAAAFSAGARVGIPRAFMVTALAIAGVCVSWIVYDVGGLGPVAYALGALATTLGGSQRHDSLVRREQAELLLAQTQRSHEEQLRAAKLEESSRIAREIHDVLAHSLAGLTIQLEATAALIEGGADQDTVLARVRRAHELARDGLRETRLAVGALRGDSDQPAPAVSRIEALVADFRASGGEVTLELDGERERLSGPGADAAVRIVQEALTNVTKHAPGSAVNVKIAAGPPLRVAVENRAPAEVLAAPLTDTGGGYGIAGMRERAEELGGTLQAGPAAAGWRVEATLP